jgi:thimet oligopeptidase
MSGTPCVPPTGTFPAASWYHLMMGYDAGYYGYLWSEVFASDLFSEFQRVGCMDAALGRRYREQILAPGGAQDGGAMLRAFLGREPSQAPWMKRIGVPAATA